MVERQRKWKGDVYNCGGANCLSTTSSFFGIVKDTYFNAEDIKNRSMGTFHNSVENDNLLICFTYDAPEIVDPGHNFSVSISQQEYSYFVTLK